MAPKKSLLALLPIGLDKNLVPLIPLYLCLLPVTSHFIQKMEAVWSFKTVPCHITTWCQMTMVLTEWTYLVQQNMVGSNVQGNTACDSVGRLVAQIQTRFVVVFLSPCWQISGKFLWNRTWVLLPTSFLLSLSFIVNLLSPVSCCISLQWDFEVFMAVKIQVKVFWVVTL